MWKLFKFLGFVIGWIAPFGVIYVNHVVLVESGYDVDMFGLFLVLIIAIAFLKFVDKKVEVWEIQDKHKVFILNWKSGKKILIAIFLTWILYTIEDDMVKIQWSGVLISGCFVIGWFLSLTGELIKNKGNTI